MGAGFKAVTVYVCMCTYLSVWPRYNGPFITDEENRGTSVHQSRVNVSTQGSALTGLRVEAEASLAEALHTVWGSYQRGRQVELPLTTSLSACGVCCACPCVCRGREGGGGCSNGVSVVCSACGVCRGKEETSELL